MNKIIFHCQNIIKNYNNEPVVQDINLELPECGFISLVGPSGVGKTTLFNVLSGVEKPDIGRVIFNGEDITGVSGKVSYMLQKDLLLEYRTVLDNVILPLIIRAEKKKSAREYAQTFFPMFGLSGYEKKYPNQLSGGMRQRAALLRTCLATGRKPEQPQNPVILLDEPFSALDAITGNKMQLWYAGIAQQMKISTLFITHDVEEALLLSDTVYIMNGKPGKITRKIDVKPPRPRDGSFPVSLEFTRQKKEILDAIGM
ncbi:MAG: ABC transporter ATP-binding protein [Treponema sp.]|jgi:ABC-type nitrate/sulfonate/bicarbonate transport system ATPase subunit|nr:ABC transporter ATP-binding protein [Treponema sp.]